MLTQAELSSLSHLLRDEPVLSVYVGGAAEDPATRHAWRVEVEHSLKDIRRWLADSSHEERAAFERCVALLEEQLVRFEGAVGAPGWAAFITRDGVRDAQRLPMPMPTLAVWSTGMCIAPYIRALKQTRPVVVVVADAQKADLYRYEGGALCLVETIRAHTVAQSRSHMGDPPRLGFHTGVRGSTGHDAAQRANDEGTDRMVAEAAHRALSLAGRVGWILAGGIPRMSAQVVRALHRPATGRVLQLDSLDIHATEAQIAAAAQRGASALRDESDLGRVSEIIGRGEGNGAIALGPEATRHALAQSRVRELYFTPQYLEDHVEEAEDAVRAALAQSALIEEVSRAVAQRLDEHGGMAARLRYTLSETQAVASSATDDASDAT